MLLPAQPLLPIFSAYVGTLALNYTCSFLQKVFILQYFLCNRKIPKNWCEANTAFLGIFLGHKFIFCNSTERPQTVCDYSLVVVETNVSPTKSNHKKFELFSKQRQNRNVAFLMLLPALPPKMRQLFRCKNHCCVRFLGSELLSSFMLEKNVPFWTTFS